VRSLCLRKTVTPTLVAVALMSLAAGMTARAADDAKVPEPAAAPAAAAPAEPAAEASGNAAAPDAKKKWIRGSFDAGLDAAWSDYGSDFDLNQYLRLDVDPPQCDKLHLRGAVWMNENLGANVPE